MAPPTRPTDLAAELELIELHRAAELAHDRTWSRARELVDERRLTAATIAGALGISVATVWRRLPPARAGQGSTQSTP